MDLTKEERAKLSQKALNHIENGSISFEVKFKHPSESEKMLFKTSEQDAFLKEVINSKEVVETIKNKLKNNLIIQPQMF